ncbi:hypothetical protein [Solitalea koreensis]|uniref:DUF4157 domain-containing protein n=1 Tax=Solitalea koreensis TaxID=543615 RepID=A0A521AZV7_9SPHI|nr:hypothetical protein [Solitalea koreensis]SMO40404.1 hypothetical protein SAMN06265350_101573 [Solitalea koreensis]
MILVSKRFLKLLTGNFAQAIALYPFIIVEYKELKDDASIINHELIHHRQQRELLVIVFYLWYVIEYIFRRIQHKTHYEAYLNISFEREAYQNDKNLNYLKNRKAWSFFKYF